MEHEQPPQPSRPRPLQKLVDASETGILLEDLPLPVDMRRYRANPFRLVSAVTGFVAVVAVIAWLSGIGSSPPLPRPSGGSVAGVLQPAGNNKALNPLNNGGITNKDGQDVNPGLEHDAGEVSKTTGLKSHEPPLAQKDNDPSGKRASGGNQNGLDSTGRSSPTGANPNTSPTAGVNDGKGVEVLEPPIGGYRYIDRLDGRPRNEWTKGVAHKGDFVSLVAQGVGKRVLYFLVLEPNNQIRLSRIYPANPKGSAHPPLKVLLNGDKSGQFQGILLASPKELDKIQYWIQDANLAIIPKKANAREVRINRLVESLQHGVDVPGWSHVVLEAVDYRPAPPGIKAGI